jgi:YggT family protein
MDPTLVRLLHTALDLLWWLLIIRVILSWVVRDPSNPIYRVVSRVTDPLLAPLQRVLTIGGIDFAPMALLLLIGFLKQSLGGGSFY